MKDIERKIDDWTRVIILTLTVITGIISSLFGKEQKKIIHATYGKEGTS